MFIFVEEYYVLGVDAILSSRNLHLSSGSMNKLGNQAANVSLRNISELVPASKCAFQKINFLGHHIENLKFCVFISVCFSLL